MREISKEIGLKENAFLKYKRKLGRVILLKYILLSMESIENEQCF